MLCIKIEIERPLAIATMLGATVGLMAVAQMFADAYTLRAQAAGGTGSAQSQIADAEKQVYRERIEQAVFERREEILRYQLRVLQEQGGSGQEYVQAQNLLKDLLMDKRKSEEHVRAALYQMWDAEGRARALTAGDVRVPLLLSWPVDPIYGISAGFHDSEYRSRFGLPHEAVDIPVEQNTVIRAAADGVVETVADNGYGFSYLILRHAGGATLYGHVRGFLVSEGQNVHKGTAIALSGGQPGTRGAGPLSTGPHLHFEVIRGGVNIDPLTILPPLPARGV